MAEEREVSVVEMLEAVDSLLDQWRLTAAWRSHDGDDGVPTGEPINNILVRHNYDLLVRLRARVAGPSLERTFYVCPRQWVVTCKYQDEARVASVMLATFPFTEDDIPVTLIAGHGEANDPTVVRVPHLAGGSGHVALEWDDGWRIVGCRCPDCEPRDSPERARIREAVEAVRAEVGGHRMSIPEYGRLDDGGTVPVGFTTCAADIANCPRCALDAVLARLGEGA